MIFDPAILPPVPHPQGVGIVRQINGTDTVNADSIRSAS